MHIRALSLAVTIAVQFAPVAAKAIDLFSADQAIVHFGHTLYERHCEEERRQLAVMGNV